MSHLSDYDILKEISAKRIGIEPYDAQRIQPASYDVALGQEICLEGGSKFNLLPDGGPMSLEPGEFLLAHTQELFRLPIDIVGRLEGKSTWGRRGLMVHSTAGLIDPGFIGQIVLELKNLNQNRVLHIEPGMLIAQVTFHRMSSPVIRPYGLPGLGSHYQGQLGATPASG